MMIARGALVGMMILQSASAFHGKISFKTKNSASSISMLSENSDYLASTFQMAEKKPKEPEKEGWERIQALISDAEKDPKKKKGPPIYEPGSYVTHALAALAYVIPIVDAQDLGKYMFEAYPAVAESYNAVFGSIAGIYNGVPFLPFGVFFLMSYICRAPTFPVEVRFHVAQAFMLSIIQFVPSLGFGLLEKAGVPGMAVLYNTVFMWVILSSVFMQALLLNPVASARNPFIVNVVGWAMRYMNYSPDMAPKK